MFAFGDCSVFRGKVGIFGIGGRGGRFGSGGIRGKSGIGGINGTSGSWIGGGKSTPGGDGIALSSSGVNSFPSFLLHILGLSKGLMVNKPAEKM